MMGWLVAAGCVAWWVLAWRFWHKGNRDLQRILREDDPYVRRLD